MFGGLPWKEIILVLPAQGDFHFQNLHSIPFYDTHCLVRNVTFLPVTDTASTAFLPVTDTASCQNLLILCTVASGIMLNEEGITLAGVISKHSVFEQENKEICASFPPS